MPDGTPRGAVTPQQVQQQLRAMRMMEDVSLVLAAREDPNIFIECIGRIEGGAWVGKQAGAHAMLQDHLTRSGAQYGATTAVALMPIGHGKALPVETPIAVPGGWKAIGELGIGDLVIGGDGLPTLVTNVSPVWHDHEVYEFDFDDGTSLRSDADHQWSAWTVNDRADGKAPRVATTREIIAKFTRASGQKFWSIPLAGPAQHPERALPVHPYVLGAWLGDGSSHNSQFTCHEADAEIVDRCIALEGGRCGKRSFKAGTRTFHQVVGGVTDKHEGFKACNLRRKLRALGVLDNKHIPADYLTASIEQRRELLAGLMDTDGTIGRLDGRLSFSNTNERLARGVLVLARSLGFKATLVSGPAKLRGVAHGTHYRVSWTCRPPVFKLRRKAAAHEAAVARQTAMGRRQNTWEAKTITAWRKVETVPVRCIAVAAAHHTYVATDQHILTHNSQQVTRWRVVWELGKNPNLRVLLMSATTSLPEKMLAGIKGDITDNPFVQAVFPHLRPGVKKGQCDWSGSSIHVDRPDNLPDASITTAGLSSKILGSRFDLIVIDDLLNTDNTLTPYMRQQVWGKVQSEVMSRRPPHLPSRAWFIGHVWTEDDGLAMACQQPGARVLRLGAKVQRHQKTGKVITSADPDWSELLTWFPLIPSLWTKAGLAARYAELRWAARHMLDNLFMRRGGGGFAPEGIARALVNGKGVQYKPTWNPLATGCPTYTGVDVSSGEGEDFTVIVTAVRLASGRRQILEIQSGKWSGPEIVERIADVYRRYHSTICVESNGVQKWLRQWLGQADALVTPVFDHSTGKNKHALNLGIKHMEMELSGEGSWIFPRPLDMFEPLDDDMRNLCHGALGYSRDEKHTSDWLMAWWICWRRLVADEGLSLT